MKFNKTGGDFTPHPETDEPVRGVIVDVTQPRPYDGKYGVQNRFKLVFETEVEKEDGERFCVWSFPYAPSLGEKANFRKDVKKMLGRDLTAQEVELLTTQDDAIETLLLGCTVLLMIEHSHDGDKTYANISALMACKKNPLTPSGKFTREKDRENKGGNTAGGGDSKASYRKTPAAGASNTAEEEGGRDDWQKCKVHVGKNAGVDLGDLDREPVEALVEKWLPKFDAADAADGKYPDGKKITADDKRLATALVAAKAALAELDAAPAETMEDF